MEDLLRLFSVETVLVKVLGYPLSCVELLGTVLLLASVWLVVRNNLWTWPVGNVAVALYAILFYQIRLYSDFFEQIYFFFTGFYGWWLWARGRRGGAGREELPIVSCGRTGNTVTISVVAAGTAALGGFMSRIHILFPSAFPQPADFPYLDALTTVMSFTAQILMAHKRIECWYLWIAVDAIGVGLYWQKGVVFIAGLYAIFLVLAARGLFRWRRERARQFLSRSAGPAPGGISAP